MGGQTQTPKELQDRLIQIHATEWIAIENSVLDMLFSSLTLARYLRVML
jgi:hypothetical protein